jgi:hypothetical protein
MRRNVTPLLVLDERSRGLSGKLAHTRIERGLEAVVSSEADAREVLRFLGLTPQEVNYRIRIANGAS